MENSSHLLYHVDCPTGSLTAIAVVLSVISLLGLGGNFLVIITFIKRENLKTSSNYYVMNMVVSDLVCVLLNWPLFATEGMLQAGGSLITDAVAASFFCKLGIYSRSLSYSVSIISLVLIAVDRFIATRFPLKSLTITGKIRTIFMLVSWGIPAFGLIPYLLYSRVIQSEEHTFCRNMMSQLLLQTYYSVGFVLLYCIPFIFIVVLYSLIMKQLRERRKLYNGDRIQSRAKRDKENQNMMKVFGSIVLGFFTCWTPLYVYMFLKSLHPSVFTKDKCRTLNLVGVLYYIFPLISTTINPFILIAFSSRYRVSFKRACFYFLSQKKGQNSPQFALAAVSPQ
ncbi:neuropeptides capa receptor-like [Montipora foliosa]|uniref:neuropeptides capa receptor-like n=1 Tax=Montipora foliosa TaxID=591990 RepID=UPI0035F1BB50